MGENNLTIEQINNKIKKLKIEIIEKEKKINELLQVINNNDENSEEDEEI